MSDTPADRGPPSSREENKSRPWTIRQLIDRLAALGEKPVLASVREDKVQYLSAAELARLSLQLAGGLIAAGVAPGEPVLLLGENSFDWVIARFAIGAMGAVPVAIDPLTPKAEISEILAMVEPRLVFITATRLPALKETMLPRQMKICVLGEDPPQSDPTVIGLRSLITVSPRDLPEIDPSSPAMMVFTSGTTGKPKRFFLNSRQIWANIEALRASGLVTAADRVFLPLPLHHAYPLVVGLLAAMESGALVIFPESTTGHAIVQALRSSHATIMIGVPRLYSALLTALEAAVSARGRILQALYHAILAGCIWLRRHVGWSPGRLIFHHLRARMGADLRLLVCGGAKIDLETVLTLEGLGWHVRSGYGLAETASVFTGNIPGSERLGSEGRPLGQGKIRISHPAEDGSGEIELRGPCVFDGYLENPEANAGAFTPDGWFRTGDLGYRDRDGFLYVTGRSKELIVLGGGKKVFPEQVEQDYAASPFIGELAVLERAGGLVALVVPNLAAIRNAGVASPENAIRVALAEISQRLPSYARLAGFAVTRQPLPRTQLGKYRRFLLPGLYERALAHAEAPESGPLSAEDQVLLAEPTAARLWDLLSKKFVQSTLTPDSSLQLDLGLDSLGWMALALEIENRLAIRFDDAAVDRILTVRDLLREAAGARKGEPAAAEPNLPESLWLAPRGWPLRAVGAVIHLVNRLVMHVAFRLRVEGIENLPPTGPFVIAANHVSFLDPAAMAAAFPWRMLAHAYWAGDRILLFSNPVSRFVCRATCIFPVDQRSPASVLASATEILRRGHVLVWFPEGWRSPTKTMLPFQPGIGRVLEDTGANVVPTYVDGTFESLPRGRRLPRLARITIHFGQAVSGATLRGDRPVGDWQAIASALRQRMEMLSRATASNAGRRDAASDE